MKTQKQRLTDRHTVAIYADQMEKLKPIADKNYRTIAGQIRLIIDEWFKINPSQG